MMIGIPIQSKNDILFLCFDTHYNSVRVFSFVDDMFSFENGGCLQGRQLKVICLEIQELKIDIGSDGSE